MQNQSLAPLLLGGLADEAANQKTAMQQFCAFAALGLRYYTLRFIDAGGGIQNVMQNLSDSVDDTRRYKEEVAKLAENLDALNTVYGNMLSAMNVRK